MKGIFYLTSSESLAGIYNFRLKTYTSEVGKASHLGTNQQSTCDETLCGFKIGHSE